MANVSSNHKPKRKRRQHDGRMVRMRQQPQLDVSANLRAAVIPSGVLNEIEKQRCVLVAAITLLHCLHVVLEHQEANVDEELSPPLSAALRWASLPEMTAMILERTLAVLSALDSMNLSKALMATES